MSRTLRFCLVTTFYPPHHFGGDGVLVYRLASALARRHHEVDVIYCVDSYRLFNRAPPPRHPPDHPNVRVHALRSRLGPLSPVYTHQTGRPGPKRRGLARILEDHAFDVIHYHNISLVGGPAVIALGRAAVRLFTAHDYWPVCPLSTLWQYGRRICTNRQCIRCGLHAGRPPQAWRATGLLARALKRIDAFLCPSVFVMQILRDHGLDLPYTHLPNFVSEPERIALDEAVAAMGPRYFLYAGRIEKHKGADDAVAVFRHHDASALWIAGEGKHEARLRRRAGGAPHIRFLGHQPRDALFALYRGAQAV
ncbi:MAG: glycosyltransferase, partial [Planctomycetes bacterium]|nr:glycosyltransferase [Planctomycetota bacterium]